MQTIAILLSLAASALAYTTPTTFNVTSNPIFTPSLGEIVPVGKPFKITWGPTETGTVSIVLLRGPSTDVQPLYAIVENIANSGSYEWTPKTDLVADTTHYGLQLIKDSDGQFQYSVQFGISNPNGPSSSASSSGSVTSTATSSSATGTDVTTSTYTTVTQTTHSSVTSMLTITTPAPYSNSTSTKPLSTYGPPPVHSTTVTSSTPASTTSSMPTPSQTGAASSVKVASSMLVGVAAIAALFL